MIVALSGFMACGKSTFGRALSKRLGWQFIDLDEMILPGCSAGEAMRKMGLEAFRERESAALSDALSVSGDLVLALGGGTVLSEANRILLRKCAKVIWLRTSMDIIESELSNADRPLAQGLGGSELESLLRRREPAYGDSADASLTIVEKDIDKVVEGLVRIIEVFEK